MANTIKMLDCTASVVIYNNPPEMIRKTVESLLTCSLNMEVHIVDNSPTDSLKTSLSDLPVKYHFCDSNVGYGRGHNRALEDCSKSKYHIIVNPDIIISKTTIESLAAFLDENDEVGIVSPRILNEDGSIQHLNKRNPTVFDLFARRFIPVSLHHLIQHRLDHYEMKDIGYDDICDVECISGCFMFCRKDALKVIGGFDNRYFMYFEDFDLSRRVQQAGYRTVYFPHNTVTHLWERASHKNLKMTLIHIHSAIKYFNKWGWKLF